MLCLIKYTKILLNPSRRYKLHDTNTHIYNYKTMAESTGFIKDENKRTAKFRERLHAGTGE